MSELQKSLVQFFSTFTPIGTKEGVKQFRNEYTRIPVKQEVLKDNKFRQIIVKFYQSKY